MQTPASQVSFCVHGLPSSHAAVPGFGMFVQTPVCGSHLPGTWHVSKAVHDTALPPVQTPAWHVSSWVHSSPSSQAAPSALTGSVQVFVLGSQMPGSWH